MTIRRTRVSAAGKAVDQDSAKSHDSERTLPLPDPLLVELRAARKRQAAEKLATGAAYADLDYVVCNEAGQPYHPDTLSKLWAKAIESAGVPRIRLHDARHTWGTTMHLQHAPAAVISAWLGHADVAFTMRTYVHSQPDALSEAAPEDVNLNEHHRAVFTELAPLAESGRLIHEPVGRCGGSGGLRMNRSGCARYASVSTAARLSRTASAVP